MNKKQYSERLADPRWQKKSAEVKIRDNWACQGCGCKTKQLEVHHMIYIGSLEPWEYPDDLLITCCRDCHENEELRPKHEHYALRSFKMCGFLASDLLALSVLLSKDEAFAEYIKTKVRQLSN